ncbi:DNA nickase [Planktothrix serta PCC 8927]|uniref:DNA nickase n=1 Tax=Planktothrix serta PCC 8927 TaxID=671068 RepID=A0A7Z9E4R4_9CYAN|nr:hemerythrin domain-containing protein [Planktothrix serta]VXD24679.1 DNA nickase [Planktothrix serta PCC 8927]
MVTTLTDAKREAIGQKLATMKTVQQLLVETEQLFVRDCNVSEIRQQFQEMLEDDQKNLGIMDTVITQYGIQSQPKEQATKMINLAKEMMNKSDLTFYEKVAQLELLKHGQVMSGLLVHKSAQVVGADVEAAITPLNTVNFESRAHQEKLKGILEYLGTQELTGQAPDQSIWGRVQDAIAALSGVMGSAVTQNSDKSDMNIQDVIRMDHQKAKTLIAEIENCNDSQKIQEYFGQLYKDLSVHSEAEEQVLYPKVRSLYDDTQNLYNEQAELKVVLEEIKSLSPSSAQFKDKVKKVKDMVNHHTREEENDVFAVIRRNLSTTEQEQLATQFKEAKKQLQTKMASQK